MKHRKVWTPSYIDDSFLGWLTLAALLLALVFACTYLSGCAASVSELPGDCAGATGAAGAPDETDPPHLSRPKKPSQPANQRPRKPEVDP